MRLSGPVFAPAKLETQEVEPGLARCVRRTERNNPRFLCRQFQPELPQSLSQPFIEALGVCLFLECAHKIIRISDQARFPTTVRDDHFLKPQVECVVQVHIGEEGRYYSPNNVAKNLLDFSKTFSRQQLRPQYGDGFAGAPLTIDRGVKQDERRKESQESSESEAQV